MSLVNESNTGLLDVIDALFAEGADDEAVMRAMDASAELRKRLAEPTYWPEQTFATAKEIFGPAVFNIDTRTYRSLDRRIRHALRIWDEKYGPLNPEQEAYADEVLAAALRAAKRDAGSDRKKLWPFTQTAIGSLVVHERVHDGFTRRARMVDVRATLAQLA